MPFNFSEFREEIHGASPDRLTQLKKKYTVAVAGTPVSGGLSVLLGPLFFIGMAGSGATAYNATRKLEIIVEEMDRQGIPHGTRLRDVARGAVTAGAFGALGHGASHIVNGAMGPGYDTLASGFGYAHEKSTEWQVEEVAELSRKPQSAYSYSMEGHRKMCDHCHEVSKPTVLSSSE